MKKIQKSLFPFFLIIFAFCFILTGCAENEDLPASKWLSVGSATGYLYDSSTNRDNSVNAVKQGFTTETMSDDDEWNTPSLRYTKIYLDVEKKCKLLGLAFELKTNEIEGFSMKIEVQVYKDISLPSNWDELTEEAKMIWEKENRIKDRQYDSVYIGKSPNAVSFSFSESAQNLDTSYEIRILFTAVEDENIEENTNHLKNFMVDNFIVLVEGE